MASLDKRVSKLEEAVEKHLIESGEIRTTLLDLKTRLYELRDVPADNKWIKKFMWFVLGSPFLVEAAKYIHLSGK